MSTTKGLKKMAREAEKGSKAGSPRAFMKWMKKLLRGRVNGSALHIASAIVSVCGFVMGSRECKTKTGEVTAFRELIELLDVAGAVVVADALHCTKKSAKAVIAASADYLFSVKDNNRSLKEDIAVIFKMKKLKPVACMIVGKNLRSSWRN